MHSNGPVGLSQSQAPEVVAQAGDIDPNGDLVGALTRRLAGALDVDGQHSVEQLVRVRARVLEVRS